MLEGTLVGRIKRAFNSESKMAFFVGAGISIPPPSRLPSFEELSREALKLVTENKLPEDEYEYLSKIIRPEVIFQIAISEMGTQALEILQRLKDHEPNFNHFFFAGAIRAGNWVFTTNYDDLIERACSKRGIALHKYTHEDDFKEFLHKYINATEELPGALFKLHGSIEDPNTIQIFLRQVGKGLSEFKTKVLRYFLQTFDFCFMGYSCLDDFSVYPILLDTESESGIYWLYHSEGRVGEAQWDRERLQYQKEAEEKQPPDRRNRKIININSVLLRRKNFLKLIGDSSKFVKDNFGQEEK